MHSRSKNLKKDPGAGKKTREIEYQKFSEKKKIPWNWLISGDFFPFFCFILLLVTIGYKKMEYHTSLVSFADILFAYNKFDSVPTFRLIKPLVGINAYLGSKRLGQNQDISNDCRVRAEIEVIFVNFIA